MYTFENNIYEFKLTLKLFSFFSKKIRQHLKLLNTLNIREVWKNSVFSVINEFSEEGKYLK